MRRETIIQVFLAAMCAVMPINDQASISHHGMVHPHSHNHRRHSNTNHGIKEIEKHKVKIERG